MRAPAVLLGLAMLLSSSSTASALGIRLFASGESIVWDGSGDVATSNVAGNLFAGGSSCGFTILVSCLPTATDFPDPASLAVRLEFEYQPVSSVVPDKVATVEQMRLLVTIPAALCLAAPNGCLSINDLTVYDPCPTSFRCDQPNVAFYADLVGPSVVGVGESLFRLAPQAQQALLALINVPSIGASNVHFGLAARLQPETYDWVVGESASVELTAVAEPAASTLLLLALCTGAARSRRRHRMTAAE